MTIFINYHLTILPPHRGLNNAILKNADFFFPHHSIATRASSGVIITKRRDYTHYKII